MAWAPIHKSAAALKVAPNLDDYARVRREFSWTSARAQLEGLPSGGINIAHEAVDRHARGASATRTAIRWIAKDGKSTDISYAALSRDSNRFANVLRGLGIGRGDSVFVLLGRVPDLYIAALGTLKNGSVFCPLFSAFGPEPIHARMSIGGARVLVTTPALFERKVAAVRDRLPSLRHILLTGADARDGAGTVALRGMLERASGEFEVASTMPEDPALLHFTSGTTGRPKGAVHVHGAIVAHHVTGRLALDLHDQDIFWCTADPGWVTGTSYGIIAPLSNGITMIVDEEEFEPERWYGILQDQEVSVWYTAPTAIRMLMKYGLDSPRGRKFPKLRFLASVGEPLNPEGVVWGQEAFGLPFHDNWWQTETGGIMIANFPAMDIRPGSMGRPLPGIEAGIVARRADGGVDLVGSPDTQGELALRPGWPSMFRTYLNEEERYRKCFAGGWYLTGDLARRDADGYFWFVGRGDDVIKSSGHLIGPFEVENVLMEHKAVAEAGVIGVPDPVALEVVKAFVALKPGFSWSPELQRELLAHARRRLGAAVAPREIEARPGLPRTRSGKIMRRLLKARELGLPEGDISTLECET